MSNKPKTIALVLTGPVLYALLTWALWTYATYQSLSSSEMLAYLLATGAVLIGSWLYFNRRLALGYKILLVALVLIITAVLYGVYSFNAGLPGGWDQLR